MSPRRKTTGILTLGGAVVIAALLLTHAAPRARSARIGGNGVAGAGGLTVAARMESTYLLRGDHEAYLALTLNAPAAQAVQRPPLHVAIVLDRSHSMYEDDGTRIVNARAAAVQLIRSLQRGDRFAVIAYNHDAEVLYPDSPAEPAAVREAVAKIDALEPVGMTNIGAALQTGAAELQRTPMPGAVARIVLVSDGESNEGMLQSELPGLAASIAEQGVSITSVGIGLDFEEHTMTRIAGAGRGNYYFVEDTGQLAAMFADELGRLAQTTASEVSVAVAPAPGVTVLDAYGYPMQQREGTVIIPVADMNSGEQRKVVLRLRVDARTLGSMELGRIVTSFRAVATGEREQAALLASATVTDDPRLVRDNYDREAVRHVQRALTARAIDEANELYANGELEKAQQLLQSRQSDASGMAAQLGYQELDTEIGGSIGRAEGNFAAAPAAPGSAGGKRATKDNGADANDLYLK
jgi:Ca-activated chloride channel family protein